VSVIGFRCFKDALAYVVLDGTPDVPEVIEHAVVRMPSPDGCSHVGAGYETAAVFFFFGCVDCSELMRGHDEDGPGGVLEDVVGGRASGSGHGAARPA
jgi:hypothetical protein